MTERLITTIVTDHPAEHGQDDEDNSAVLRTAVITIYVILMVVIVLGNGLITLCILHDRSMWTVTNVFVFSKACADLLVGFFVIPAITSHLGNTEELGVFQCQLLPFLQLLSIAASIFSMVVICLDRYHRIIPTHITKWSMVKALKIVTIVWLASCLYASRFYIQELIFIQQNKPDYDNEDETHDMNTTYSVGGQHTVEAFCVSFTHVYEVDVYFRMFDFLIIFIVPLIVLVFHYSRIIQRLNTPNTASSSLFSMTKRKLVKMFIIITACFFFCWIPWHLNSIIHDVIKLTNGESLAKDSHDGNHDENDHKLSIELVTTIIAISNSGMSPVIYFTYSSLFSAKIHRLFTDTCLRCYNKVEPAHLTSISVINIIPERQH